MAEDSIRSIDECSYGMANFRVWLPQIQELNDEAYFNDPMPLQAPFFEFVQPVGGREDAVLDWMHGGRSRII